MSPEDLVFLAVEYGKELGATYVEARYHKNYLISIVARNGKIIDSSIKLQEGMGIRVLVEGSLGFSSTNKLSKEDVRSAVEKALRQAKSYSYLLRKPIEFSQEKVGNMRYEVKEKIPFNNIDIEEKISVLKNLWSSVHGSTREAKLPVFFTYYTESIEEKIVASSDGAFVQSKIPRLSLRYNVVVYHPQKGSIQKHGMYGGSGGFELYKQWDLENTLATEVGNYEKILLQAKMPPKEKVSIILGSEIVGLIVHESCGHPLEADRILGREAAQAGKSFITPEMLYSKEPLQIGNEYATVIDDPTIPGSYGFYLYDDEGVPARPRYLYHKGFVNELLHNKWTAKIFNTSSNAAARAMDYSSEPLIRMANTFLSPGDYDFDEIIQDTKKGVYIKSFMEWNIDDKRWSQRYVGLEAYLVEKGSIKYPVRNPVLEITTKTFYSNIDAVGKEVRFYAAICGKGEPAQGVPVWLGGPEVRLKNMRLGVAL